MTLTQKFYPLLKCLVILRTGDVLNKKTTKLLFNLTFYITFKSLKHFDKFTHAVIMTTVKLVSHWAATVGD